MQYSFDAAQPVSRQALITPDLVASHAPANDESRLDGSNSEPVSLVLPNDGAVTKDAEGSVSEALVAAEGSFSDSVPSDVEMLLSAVLQRGGFFGMGPSQCVCSVEVVASDGIPYDAAIVIASDLCESSFFSMDPSKCYCDFEGAVQVVPSDDAIYDSGVSTTEYLQEGNVLGVDYSLHSYTVSG